MPYAFVYNSALVMQGSAFEVVWVTLTSAVGVAALAAAIIGVHLRKSNWIERAISAAAALLLISPEKISDVVGLALIVAVLTFQYTRRSPGLISSRSNTTSCSIPPYVIWMLLPQVPLPRHRQERRADVRASRARQSLSRPQPTCARVREDAGWRAPSRAVQHAIQKVP